jgi:hypothetical protein
MTIIDMKTTRPKYSYQLLESATSFRLLKVDWKLGTTARALREPLFSLFHTTTKAAPRYDTVSYVWGPPHRTKELWLQDGTAILITEALEAALPHITIHSTGYLWIDQICINQDDIVERGHQVSIMGQIYAECACVLIWPGHVRSLGTLLTPICNELDGILADAVRTDEEKTRLKNLIRRLADPATAPETLTHQCWAMTRSPWFSRAWVFQEVVLPPQSKFILSGRKATSPMRISVSLPTIYILCEAAWKLMAEDSQAAETPRFGVLREMYDRWAERHRPRDEKHFDTPLEQILSGLSPRAKTSVDLDRLYAFFGLNRRPQIELNPIYGISFTDALIITTCAIIEGSCGLDIFEVLPRRYETSASTEESRGRPSWVPNFRRPT